MLSPAIAESLSKEEYKPFMIDKIEREVLKFDDDERVYIDVFKEVGEGKLDKGQFSKKTGLRDGLGI